SFGSGSFGSGSFGSGSFGSVFGSGSVGSGSTSFSAQPVIKNAAKLANTTKKYKFFITYLIIFVYNSNRNNPVWQNLKH
ncbi:MAG: hypothetical protein QF825_11720, partial [SAR324 cluster bacterium]|nr:hypothetical protein [SAR324 cluster bacterium]